MHLRFPVLVAILGCIVVPGVLAQSTQPTHKPGGYMSPDIPMDGHWVLRADWTGMSWYHCHPHPYMHGTIEVRSNASKDPVTIDVRGFKFTPEAIVVGPGTDVTFVNHDSASHMVAESVPPGEQAGSGSSPSVGVAVIALGIVAAALLLQARRP